MTENHHFETEKSFSLEYDDLCQLMREIFVQKFPELEAEDLLIKVDVDQEKGALHATVKLCQSQGLSLVHRERGERLDS